MSLPVNFNETTVDYGLVSFGGTNSTIVIDPTDANNKVAKVIKSNTLSYGLVLLFLLLELQNQVLVQLFLLQLTKKE